MTDRLVTIVVNQDRTVDIHPGEASGWDDVGLIFRAAGAVMDAVCPDCTVSDPCNEEDEAS